MKFRKILIVIASITDCDQRLKKDSKYRINKIVIRIKLVMGSDAVTKKKNKFVHYLVLVTLGIIGETVLSIYLIENVEGSTQYRIHMRYFFPLFIPYILCMLKIVKQKISKNTHYIFITSLILITILFILYFVPKLIVIPKIYKIIPFIIKKMVCIVILGNCEICL